MKELISSIIVTLFFSTFVGISAEELPQATNQTTEVPSKPEIATEKEVVQFDLPPGWRAAKEPLPSGVVMMYVGPCLASSVPPALHLVIDPYKGSVKDYLKTVKALNEAKGLEWKSHGKIRTLAGEGHLSEVKSRNQWGEMREMHLILKHNEKIYILGASASNEEFPKFTKEFNQAMRSLKINKVLNESSLTMK